MPLMLPRALASRRSTYVFPLSAVFTSLTLLGAAQNLEDRLVERGSAVFVEGHLWRSRGKVKMQSVRDTAELTTLVDLHIQKLQKCKLRVRVAVEFQLVVTPLLCLWAQN